MTHAAATTSTTPTAGDVAATRGAATTVAGATCSQTPGVAGDPTGTIAPAPHRPRHLLRPRPRLWALWRSSPLCSGTNPEQMIVCPSQVSCWFPRLKRACEDTIARCEGLQGSSHKCPDGLDVTTWEVENMRKSTRPIHN